MSSRLRMAKRVGEAMSGLVVRVEVEPLTPDAMQKRRWYDRQKKQPSERRLERLGKRTVTVLHDPQGFTTRGLDDEDTGHED